MPDDAARIRTVIADDEPVARELLRRLAEQDAELEIIAECESGAQVVEAVRAMRPQLLILDVQMPGMDGFEALEALGDEEQPIVIFATAYDQHALRAFEVHAIDYLLKPFDARRFHLAVARAKGRLREETAASTRRAITALLDTVRMHKHARGERLQRLAVQRAGGTDYVQIDAVEWIEAKGAVVRVHAGGEPMVVRASLGQLERTLDPARFLRVHRSAIVALDRVRSLETNVDGGARILLASGERVPVGRTRLSSLRDRLR